MLNGRQRAILAAAAVVAGLMLLFPPFFDTGGLVGGLRFGFVLLPPRPNYALDVRPQIAVEPLLFQLGTVACLALAAAIASDSRSRRLQRSAARTGGFLAALFTAGMLGFSATSPDRGWMAAPFLLCLIPVQYPGGYFLFWLRLASLALVTLLAVTLAGRRSPGAVLDRVAPAASAALFMLLVVAYARAASR
jgi:hypothetical protein